MLGIGGNLKRAGRKFDRVRVGLLTLGASEQKRAMEKQIAAQEEMQRQEMEMFQKQMEEERKRREEMNKRAIEEQRRATEEQARLNREAAAKRKAEADYNRQLSQDAGGLAQASVNSVMRQPTQMSSRVDYSGSVDKRFSKKEEEEKDKLKKAFMVR